MFGQELEEDVGGELAKLGEVEKITLFERNPAGVIVVKFASSVGAQKCIQVMNGRWFSQRKVSATYWDGKKDYTVKASEKDEAKRLKEFGDWLEQEPSDDEEEGKESSAAPAALAALAAPAAPVEGGSGGGSS